VRFRKNDGMPLLGARSFIEHLHGTVHSVIKHKINVLTCQKKRNSFLREDVVQELNG
jgi:hypothetical protein